MLSSFLIFLVFPTKKREQKKRKSTKGVMTYSENFFNLKLFYRIFRFLKKFNKQGQKLSIRTQVKVLIRSEGLLIKLKEIIAQPIHYY